jgi:Lysyl oxidase
MRHRYRRALKWAAPTTALMVAAGLSAVLPITGAEAAESAPTLKLVVPTATQKIDRWSDEDIYLYDLNMYAIATKKIEINTRRALPYTNPVQSKITIGEGSTAKTTTLTTAQMPYVDHLDKFFTLQIKDAQGKVVKNTTTSFCPGSWQAARATADAPSTSPYPQQCGDHPFALGGVLGIQRGWSVPALGDWYSPASFTGPDGTYKIHIVINPTWQKILGLTAAQSAADITIDVTTSDDGGKGRSAATSMAGMAGMSGMEHMDHEGAAPQLSPQHAAMEAGRKASLGHRNTPNAQRPTQIKALKAMTAQGAGTTAAADIPKPDLRSLPAYQIGLDTESEPGKTYIDFGATVWNAGRSPLVVDGFRKVGTDEMDAYQYFFDKSGQQVGYTPAGGLQWDGREGHNHWHFKAFASYSLLDANQKNPILSQKEAFCLAPTDAIDLHVTNANWKPSSTDLTTACGQDSQGTLSIREVLDSGWGDTYGQYLPGQSFDITDVANGTYFIEVKANPDKVLTESDTTNNRALRKIVIGGTKGGKRTIKVPAYQGIAAP